MGTPAPPHLPPGERLRRLGVAAWSIIGVLIVAAIAVWALLEIRVIFPPLALALLIIYLLNPLVTALDNRGIPRWLGAIGTYIVVLGGAGVLIIALIPFISGQATDLAREWPEIRQELVGFVQERAEDIEGAFGVEVPTTRLACLLGAEKLGRLPEVSREVCDEVTARFREQIAEQAGRITRLGSNVLEGLLVFILAPLIALYLLIDLPQIQRDLINLVPVAHRPEATDLAAKVGRAVGGFFRGQLLVALLVGLLTSIGFWIIDLPFWLVIGGIAGFTNLIPLVGPFIGGGLGLLVGALSSGVALALKAALVALIVQQLDNHIISPVVMKRTVKLHPATVVLALLAGAALAGFWGILLAVPAVAVAKLLLGHLWATRVLGEPVSPYVTTKSANEQRQPDPDGD